MWLATLPIKRTERNDLAVVDGGAGWHGLKAPALDSISSPITKRVCNLGLDEFFKRYEQEPRSGFTKTTVSAWPSSVVCVSLHKGDHDIGIIQYLNRRNDERSTKDGAVFWSARSGDPCGTGSALGCVRCQRF